MTWQIDLAHSQIEFTVRHMMISNVRGRFSEFSGTINFDEKDPARSSVEVQIPAAAISTRNTDRDNHLKSPDFLNTAEYPNITFKSKRVQKLSPTTGRIVGDLTIRDVTREVVLETEYVGQAKSPYGVVNAGFNAATTINRKDWGLNWNVALETGGWLVGDDIKINIELELSKQPETVEVALN